MPIKVIVSKNDSDGKGRPKQSQRMTGEGEGTVGRGGSGPSRQETTCQEHRPGGLRIKVGKVADEEEKE